MFQYALLMRNGDLKTETHEGRNLLRKSPISLDKLELEMFKRGFQSRTELAKAAGMSLRTLAEVFATGAATQRTKLQLSLALQKQAVVADPELLEAS